MKKDKIKNFGEGLGMKKIIGAFIVICLIAGVIDGLKSDEINSQNAQMNQSATQQTQTYPNQYLYQYSNPNSVRYPCPRCSGTGSTKCKVCKGTGINSDYDKLSYVQKGFSKPYCEGCDGNGWITCGRCHGTGWD